MKSAHFVILLAALNLVACVTARDGRRKFDPWEATLRLDDRIDRELRDLGYPSERSVFRTAKE